LLGPLIAIHEFGHYWVARKLGVKVLVYSIGFGPTVLNWTSKKSGIQYRLSALPLGGYVKMLDEREGDVKLKIYLMHLIVSLLGNVLRLLQQGH
jgi:regulator of sigma E protease